MVDNSASEQRRRDLLRKFTRTQLLPLCPQRIKKQTPEPLVRERTIPTERPPLVGEI
jgi:hypothetical protein